MNLIPHPGIGGESHTGSQVESQTTGTHPPEEQQPNVIFLIECSIYFIQEINE